MFPFVVVLAGITLHGAQDFGPAPLETVDTVGSFNRLADVFTYCDFSATQTSKRANADGSGFVVVDRVSVKACPDALVVHTESLVKDQLTSAREPLLDRTSWQEKRYLRNEPLFVLDLKAGPGKQWPFGNPSSASAISVVSATQTPNRVRDAVYVWDPLVVAAFLSEAYAAGGPFGDMVSGIQPWAYKVEKVVWSSSDRSGNVSYHYISPQFGTMEVAFSKLDEWRPTRIRLLKLADHLVDTMFAPKNRVSNFQEFAGFSKMTTGLDQLELDYEVVYSPAVAGPVLPKRIRCTHLRSWNNEQSVVDIVLAFERLHSGSVTCNDVVAAMLPIPDGTEAFMAGVPGLEDLEWTTKSGKLIKAGSMEAADIGKAATFSTARRYSVILSTLVVVVLTGLILYRRVGVRGG